MSEADKIRTSGAILNDFTLTNTWKELDLNLVKPFRINKNE
jgi:hypothetical protein